jgi:hypothetical protein
MSKTRGDRRLRLGELAILAPLASPLPDEQSRPLIHLRSQESARLGLKHGDETTEGSGG